MARNPVQANFYSILLSLLISHMYRVHKTKIWDALNARVTFVAYFSLCRSGILLQNKSS